MSQAQSKALVKRAALPNVSTGSGDRTRQPSVQWESGFFPGGEAFVAWSWLLCSISMEFRMSGAVPIFPYVLSWWGQWKPLHYRRWCCPASWTDQTGTLTFWHRSFTFDSNKSPTWCNNFWVYYPDVCLQLNMFWAFSCLSSGAQWLQWQPLVLPSYCDSHATAMNTAWLSPRYEGKTRGCHCSHWAPHDGRENARNMLSCKQMSG
jgi:hypothetical protein